MYNVRSHLLTVSLVLNSWTQVLFFILSFSGMPATIKRNKSVVSQFIRLLQADKKSAYKSPFVNITA